LIPLAPASDSPQIAPDGVPYEWIDAASSIGKVVAINPEFAFVIVSLAAPPSQALQSGVRVAFRRDGVITGQALVDRVEEPRTLVVQVRSGRVAIGDAVIFYPPSPPKP
jgi:hypothetical protein